MNRKGNSLYEVLKSASRPAAADEGAPASPEPPASSAAENGSTLQERLAAYKAAKLAAATQPSPSPAVQPAPAKPSVSTLVLEPDPTPIPPTMTRVERPGPAPVREDSESMPLPAVASKGPGERVVKLTYNTVLFGGMIAVGLLFISYAVGLQVGKSSAAAAAPVEVVRPASKAPQLVVPAPLLPPPPAPRKEYTIRLGEWKYSSSQDRVKALALADDPELRKALERSGHRSFEKALITRGSEVKLALYVNRFTDLNSEAARSALTAMKTFRFKGQTPFALAAFEEIQPR